VGKDACDEDANWDSAGRNGVGLSGAAQAGAQNSAGAAAANAGEPAAHVTLERRGETISLEAYAPNIIRVTLSLKPEPAVAPPGYGIVAKPAGDGWTSRRTGRADVFASGRIVATVDRPFEWPRPSSPPPAQKPKPGDTSAYFMGSTPGAHIVFSTPEGKKLLELTGLVAGAFPTRRTAPQYVLQDRRPGDPGVLYRGRNLRLAGR
jgi:alpha-D-xyloside xylohydrolase